MDGHGGIDLSPDGREVAFAWDRTHDLEIYAAPLAGERIIQLTGAGKRSFAPAWSPDGSWIAFLRDEGDGWARIRLVDRDGARERELTGDEDVAHGELAWSPDATRLAYVATPRGGGTALHVMEVATREHRQLAEGRAPRWSPDGRWILFSRQDGSEDLFVVAPDGGDARLLDTRGGAAGRSTAGRWSPDGTAIAFATNVRDRWEIALAWVHEGTALRIEHLGATPFDDTDPVWRPDGRGVVYRHHEDGSVSLRRVFTISHADEALADLAGVHRSPLVSSDSETVAAVLARSRRPAEVVVRAAGGIEVVPITSSLPPTLDPGVLVEPVHVAYAQGGGAGLGALVYLPHLEARGPSATVPAVIYVRAAGARCERDWDPAAQLLANHGYVVMVPEVRGDGDVRRAAEWLRHEGVAEWTAERAALDTGPLTTRARRIEAHRELLQWAEHLRGPL